MAAGPSGLLSETANSGRNRGINMITHLINQITKGVVVPTEWNLSTIVNCYKKGGMLWREETIRERN